MTTSGSIDYSLTAADLIDEALREINVLAEGQSASSTQQTQALVRLNTMIKHDQARLRGLWRYQEAKLYVVAGQSSYAISGANAADVAEITETTLDASEAAGQSTLSVSATTNFANNDVIGVLLDSNEYHWSTISSFSAGDTVTIADALPSIAASGNKVVVYTSAAPRPLRIISMRRELDSNEIEVFQLSREEYFNLPNKDNEGSPVQYYYDPQTEAGKVYLWPTPDSGAYEMNYTYLDSLEDIDNVSETLDYPQEWFDYLIYNLALRLAPQYGKTPSPVTIAAARDTKMVLSEWDEEETSVYFGVENA